ncbi:MAG: histidine kinase [Bacteroidetes bacterium]|nr:histidine kinase [Bacteroidota bacterium]
MGFPAVQAQTPEPLHYTVRDGLPSSVTYAMAQDDRGYIWIGTEAGLVRFDGLQFKVFTTQDGLPDNEVLGLIFDSITSRLWIATYSNYACYYRHGSFFTANNDSSLLKIQCEFGEFLNMNRRYPNGVFLYNGRRIYECARDSIVSYMLRIAPIMQVYRPSDSALEVLCDSGCIRYTPGHIYYDYVGLDNKSYINNGCWMGGCLLRYAPGRLEVHKRQSDGNYHKWRTIKLPQDYRPTSLTRQDGRYYISVVNKGLYEIDTAFSGPLMQVWCGNINCAYADQKGNLWILTSDNGLYVFPQGDLHSTALHHILPQINITALCRGEGDTAYIGTSDGRIFLQTGDKTLDMNIEAGGAPEKIRQLAVIDHRIFCITSNKIFFYDRFTKRITLIPHDSGGPKTFLKIRNEPVLLVGLVGSMISVNLLTGLFEENNSNYRRFMNIVQHPDGRLFLAGIDGIYEYKDRHRAVAINTQDKRMKVRITSLCFTPDSLLWIGTPATGVLVYDGQKVISHISASTYPSYHGSMCRKIIVGSHSTVWIATNFGIDKIVYQYHNKVFKVQQITPFNIPDGLQSYDVNDIMVSDSLIYVATSGGLTILNEKRMSAAKPIPIYIASVRVNDKDSSIKSSAYQFKYFENNLKIEYVAVMLPSASDLEYEYRLLGSGNDRWTTTTNRSVDFRSLSPGSYTFEVAALDKFGNRSPSVARVRFEITPAFYTTWWFMVIVMIAILTIGFLIIRDRFRRQQRRFEHEQSLQNKIIDLEQQALKAQMNPHFIFNCLTAVQHFVNQEDMYSANMYLSNFARLIRKTLDLSGEQYISLDEEVSYLRDYVQMECLRFGDKFTYEIAVSEDMDTFEVQVPPMLLQPIVENAIRHGLRNLEDKKGLLRISFVLKESVLYCTVEDNGIGRVRAREMKTTMHVEYQSKGMSLTEMRIQAINQISDKKIRMEVKDKYDHNNLPAGTLFTLIFEQ